MAYSVAVASSCTIALGMKRVVDRFDAGFLLKSVLQKSVPFTAVAMAGTINVVLMRQKELTFEFIPNFTISPQVMVSKCMMKREIHLVFQVSLDLRQYLR